MTTVNSPTPRIDTLVALLAKLDMSESSLTFRKYHHETNFAGPDPLSSLAVICSFHHDSGDSVCIASAEDSSVLYIAGASQPTQNLKTFIEVCISKAISADKHEYTPEMYEFCEHKLVSLLRTVVEDNQIEELKQRLPDTESTSKTVSALTCSVQTLCETIDQQIGDPTTLRATKKTAFLSFHRAVVSLVKYVNQNDQAFWDFWPEPMWPELQRCLELSIALQRFSKLHIRNLNMPSIEWIDSGVPQPFAATVRASDMHDMLKKYAHYSHEEVEKIFKRSMNPYCTLAVDKNPGEVKYGSEASVVHPFAALIARLVEVPDIDRTIGASKFPCHACIFLLDWLKKTHRIDKAVRPYNCHTIFTIPWTCPPVDDMEGLEEALEREVIELAAIDMVPNTESF